MAIEVEYNTYFGHLCNFVAGFCYLPPSIQTWPWWVWRHWFLQSCDILEWTLTPDSAGWIQMTCNLTISGKNGSIILSCHQHQPRQKGMGVPAQCTGVLLLGTFCSCFLLTSFCFKLTTKTRTFTSNIARNMVHGFFHWLSCICQLQLHTNRVKIVFEGPFVFVLYYNSVFKIMSAKFASETEETWRISVWRLSIYLNQLSLL